MQVLSDLIDTIIKAIGGIYPISKDIYDIIGIFFSVIVIHKTFYFIIGILSSVVFATAFFSNSSSLCSVVTS